MSVSYRSCAFNLQSCQLQEWASSDNVEGLKPAGDVILCQAMECLQTGSLQQRALPGLENIRSSKGPIF
jgi:hypothetical protein